MAWEHWQYHKLEINPSTGIIKGYHECDTRALRLLINDDTDVVDDAAVEKFCKRYLAVPCPESDNCPTERHVTVYYTSSFDITRQLLGHRYIDTYHFDGIIQDIIRDDTGELDGENNLNHLRYGINGPTPPIMVVTNNTHYAETLRQRDGNNRLRAIGKQPEPDRRTKVECDEIRNHFSSMEEHQSLMRDPCLREYRKIAGTQMLKSIRHFISKLDSTSGQRLPIVIWGESGTGKEAIARLVHRYDRKETDPQFKRFVPINLNESGEGTVHGNLYGVARLSPADTSKNNAEPIVGYLQQANKGTAFFDEFTDMPQYMHSALLRFLQEGEIAPIGSARERLDDVRCVFASNCTPDDARKNIRGDLLSRIDGLKFVCPPLRDREDDIDELIDHFIALAGIIDHVDNNELITRSARELIKETCLNGGFWGNARQLGNFIRKAAVLNPPGKPLDIKSLEQSYKQSSWPPDITFPRS